MKKYLLIFILCFCFVSASAASASSGSGGESFVDGFDNLAVGVKNSVVRNSNENKKDKVNTKKLSEVDKSGDDFCRDARNAMNDTNYTHKTGSMQDCDKAKNQKKDLQEAIEEKEKEIEDAKNENPPDKKKIVDLEKELLELKKAFSVLESSLMNCCGFGGPGGGIGDGLPPKDDDGGISLPEVTLPRTTVPPAPEYQYAACDYTSPDFNNMHKCVLKENFEPGDIPCNVNQNQTRTVDPASMDQQSQQNFISKFTNGIAGLFGAEQPYVAGPVQVVYNPACYQGATPPPTGPTPPPTGPGGTIPGQPPPTPGDPGDPANPVVTTTTTTKPRDPAPQGCQIQDFFGRREKLSENINKDIYTLVGYPKGGLLEKTGIDYAIVYCEECNMTIRSLKDEKDLSRFIKDNDIFAKNLEPMIFEEKYPLYGYSYQNAGKIIQLQVENLPIGQYELTITCKSKEGEIVTKSIRLSRLPVFRWREVAPVSKND